MDGGIGFLVPMAAMLVIMYFLILRPQQKRAKEQQEMLKAIRRGDTVVSTGGLIGKVTKATDDNEIEVEIAPNVRVRLVRQQVAEVRAKGEPVKDKDQ
ncbi:preprotein translocase subunit YajC [Methylovirgula sp. 4M-Z18]|uniref:preprotein translocase subunit YajC n=1 Tax=Methylovirgula sp. 4M-Z18 TaxID=2293567 RepID=UPI000E2EFFAE|nr:preprotein translocase subunit YajC [Methylovirgula sp. 4M-Z18]RFB81025.1 preprotein translocase subunit YajC [Methylovirgula sp. 4M-Z18]